MPLHPALDRLIQTKLAHTVAPQWEQPIADVRRAFRALWTPALTGEPAPMYKIDDVSVPGPSASLRARVYTPEPARPLPLMLYFHGGGFVKGGIEESDVLSRGLARATRHVVLTIEYRLAPEHPFPAALDDALAATAWAVTNAAALGGAADSVVVCGESAGGNLAAVVSLLARTDPRIAIRYQVLLQPTVDFTLSFPSIGLPSTQCLVPRDDLAWYYKTYYGPERRLKDSRVSPIFADELSGLPPALIIAAEYDTLRDEAAAYAKRLRAAGVPVRYTCYDGMVHGFLGMGGLVAEAGAAFDQVAQTLTRA